MKAEKICYKMDMTNQVCRGGALNFKIWASRRSPIGLRRFHIEHEMSQSHPAVLDLQRPQVFQEYIWHVCVTTSHNICRMWLLIHALNTCFWHQSPELRIYFKNILGCDCFQVHHPYQHMCILTVLIFYRSIRVLNFISITNLLNVGPLGSYLIAWIDISPSMNK